MTLLLDAFVAAVGIAAAWYGWPMIPVLVFAGVLFGVTGTVWLVDDAIRAVLHWLDVQQWRRGFADTEPGR